jgi:hypothetical protein
MHWPSSDARTVGPLQGDAASGRRCAVETSRKPTSVKMRHGAENEHLFGTNLDFVEQKRYIRCGPKADNVQV